MALPQDGQNANGLTKVTEVPTGKELIFVDPTTNEGGIITLEDLTTQILNKLTSKIFTLDQGNITLIEALNKLNSKKVNFYTYMLRVDSSLDITLPYREGVYILTIKHNFAGNNVYIIQGYSENDHASINAIRRGYEKFVVTSKGVDTLTISQKDTGGDSDVGLIRLC